MSTIKLKVIAVSQAEGFQIGHEISEKSLPLSQAKSYFDRIKKHKPSSRMMIPSEDSGYAFDNYGNLIKNGNHFYNKFGRLEMKPKAETKEDSKPVAEAKEEAKTPKK